MFVGNGCLINHDKPTTLARASSFDGSRAHIPAMLKDVEPVETAQDEDGTILWWWTASYMVCIGSSGLENWSEMIANHKSEEILVRISIHHSVSLRFFGKGSFLPTAYVMLSLQGWWTFPNLVFKWCGLYWMRLLKSSQPNTHEASRKVPWQFFHKEQTYPTSWGNGKIIFKRCL